MAPASLTVNIQEADFDVAALQQQLLQAEQEEGAVATFTGYVRAAGDQPGVRSMELEHYPGMTERSILAILQESSQCWPVLAASVVHRVGCLRTGDRIVWVGVASAHRAAAFSACEFIMDYLKHRAPFWKKETGPEGSRWVEARTDDAWRAARWRAPSSDNPNG